MTKPITTVSITFLGTCQHRLTHKSVLVSAHDQIQELSTKPDAQVAAWLIDGPGCYGSIEDPTPGTYFYHDGKKIVNRALVDEHVRNFSYLLDRNYRAVTGEGVESSLLEASTYLEEIIAKNRGKLPKELNLQGFSRGADSCVRLANIIYQMHPSIKINLFLVDPVPGPRRRDDPNSYYLPPSVQDCQINLMLNEHRQPYDPQHEDRYVFTNPKTKVSINYLPGRHGAGLSTREGSALTPKVSQTLVQDGLLKFNIEHGVLPKNTTCPNWHYSVGSLGHNEPRPLDTPQKPLRKQQRFAYLCEAMDAFQRLSGRWKTKMYHQRRIYYDRAKYVEDAHLFLNQEHRELFKKLYPATFNWFFEKNVKSKGLKQAHTKAAVFRELKKLNQPPYTEFYENFIRSFGMSEVTKLDDVINEPQGVARIEKSSYGEPLVRDELSYLEFSLQSIVRHYHYRVPSFWYSALFSDTEVYFNKNWRADRIAKDIQAALLQAKKLPYNEAIDVLRQTISNVQEQHDNGYFVYEISKIIPDSKKYLQSVLKTLQRYHSVLPELQADLVNKTIDLVKKQIHNPHKDDYQKRQHVQMYLIGLNTTLHHIDSRVSVGTSGIVYQQMLDSINQLARPSYAETSMRDNLIIELESYVRWRTFLSAIPFGQALGLYNPENVALARNVLVHLYELKNSESNLTQMVDVLRNASNEYARTHKRIANESDFTFWKKHIIYKADPLNRIIENNLNKVTKFTKLIFSVPKGPHNESNLNYQ